MRADPSGRRRRTLMAAGAGLALGVLALGPALAPGFTLAYDMVFVPHPEFTEATFGLTGMLPRHVPSDAVVTALSSVVPADVVQKAILLGIFVLACASAAALVPASRTAPRLAAGVVYAWNPFVAERLLLGQWALLLGYAALPAVAAVAARGRLRRLPVALLPAAVGGFAAMAVSGLVGGAVTAWRRDLPGEEGAAGPGAAGADGRRRAGRVAAAVLVSAAVCLPWLVPGLLRAHGAPGDPAGVAAFAARADTPFGTLGSLLLLGGAWNAETVPAGYGSLVTALPWLAVVALALAAYARGRGRVPGLGVAAVAGFALAALGAVAPGVLRAAVGMWPGFAVLRDGQQFVAPLAVVVAAGAGMAVDRLGRATRPAAGAAPATAVPAVPVRPAFPTLLGPLIAPAPLVPLVLLPGLAWGGGGRLHAVRYPADWARARAAVAAAPGDVLVLPWEAYRAYPWNGGRRVLDPLPRFLPVRVVLDDAVRVGTRGGGSVRLAAEDPRARALGPLVRSGPVSAAGLRARGVRYIAVDVPGDPAAAGPAGAQAVVTGRDLVLYRLPGAVTPTRDDHAPQRLVAIAWFITFATFLWSIPIPGSSLIARSQPKEP